MEITPEIYSEEISPNTMTWHMNMFKIGRYNNLLLMNDLTLFSLTIVGVKKKDLRNFNELIRNHFHTQLLAEGYNPEKINLFLSQIDEVTFTKTHNRRIVGCMVDIVKLVNHIYPTGNDLIAENPVEINRYNNDMFFSVTKERPSKMFKEQLESL